MGMHRHAGLYETNILFRRHNLPKMIAMDDAWWNLFRLCSTRDQLTFTPVLFCPKHCGNTGYQGLPLLLFGEGNHARNVDFVEYSIHPGGKGPVLSPLSYNLRSLLALWLRLRIKCFAK